MRERSGSLARALVVAVIAVGLLVVGFALATSDGASTVDCRPAPATAQKSVLDFLGPKFSPTPSPPTPAPMTSDCRSR